MIRRLLLFLALLGILAGYFYIHKPITPAAALSLARVAGDALVVVWLTLLAGAAGRRAVHAQFDLDAHPAGERCALEAALGWGAIGLMTLGLGLAGLHAAWIAALLSAGALIWLRREALAWLKDLRQAIAAMWPEGGFDRLAAAFAFLALGLGLLRALAPPLAWDAHVYHLTLPKLYAQAGGLQIETEILFSGMPALNEMLFTLAYLLRGEIAAQALGWAFGAVLAIGLSAHAGRLLGPRGAALAPAILFSAYTIAHSLAWAYAELLLMLMALAALIAARQWSLTRRRRWLILAGLFAGLAMSCKYTGLIVPAALAAVVVSQHGLRRWRPALGSLIALGLACLLVVAPWLIKNFLFTGNPVYPLLLPAGAVDALRLFSYNRPDLADRNPLWAALIFFRAVFLGTQGANDYDATLGPLWAVLPPILFLGWRGLGMEARTALRPVIVFALAAYAAWVALMFTSQFAVQARLFFAIFPALAILGAAGLLAAAHLDLPALRLSRIVQAVAALVFGLTALELGLNFGARSPVAYLAGAQTADEYRRLHLGWYALAIEQVNLLPPGARVIFLWEPRSLNCLAPGRCMPDAVIDRWWHLRQTAGSAEAILARWRADGATHLLIFEAGAEFVRSDPDSLLAAADWAELEQLRDRLPARQDLGGVYSLYPLTR